MTLEKITSFYWIFLLSIPHLYKAYLDCLYKALLLCSSNHDIGLYNMGWFKYGSYIMEFHKIFKLSIDLEIDQINKIHLFVRSTK